MKNRREFLNGVVMAGMTGCAHKANITRAPLTYGMMPNLMPIRAQRDRIFRVTVCSRPFRAAGPRLDVERVGDKTVVHNYGHGGSGWSLSWGSSGIAVEKALTAGERDVAVIGCGALGLTSAILLQRAGAKVTIYAKERGHGGAIRASDRRMVARLTCRLDELSFARFSGAVGKDVPQFVSYLWKLSGHGGESRGMEGSLLTLGCEPRRCAKHPSARR